MLTIFILNDVTKGYRCGKWLCFFLLSSAHLEQIISFIGDNKERRIVNNILKYPKSPLNLDCWKKFK